MKFTSEVPTKDGYYLWRLDLNFKPYIVTVENGYTEAGVLPPEMSGEWCRLVPCDECVPKEEIKEAFNEAIELQSNHHYPYSQFNDPWPQSRAKRIMEGLQ